mgnify:CR=1 FL=1
MTDTDEPGYAAALRELEGILDRLEHDEPDVDRVAADVARAAELVRLCRGRIQDARLRVDEVAADLTPADQDDDPPVGTDD